MGVHKLLVCVEAGVCVQAGELFPVLGENGCVWEILLGASYRKISKRSGRVQGWKNGPKFGYEPEPRDVST